MASTVGSRYVTMAAATVLSGRGDNNIDDVTTASSNLTVTSPMDGPLSWQDLGVRGDGWLECSEWYATMPGSMFQVFCVLMCLAFMGSGHNFVAATYLHVLSGLAFFFLVVWAAVDVAAIDIILWGLVIVVVNALQIGYNVYTSRKIEEVFSSDMNMIYHARFAHFGVSPQMFVELVTCKGCELLKLSKGQNYCAEGKTPIEKVSMVLMGRLKVGMNGKFLHNISSKDFVDSPEWESLKGVANPKAVYKVTIMADSEVRYITWKRKPLLALLSKRKRLGKLMSHMIGTDIVKKLIALNERQFTARGFHYDIRLPCIMSLSDDVKKRERRKHDGSSTPASPATAARRPRKLGKKATQQYSNMFARRMSQKIQALKQGKLLKH